MSPLLPEHDTADGCIILDIPAEAVPLEMAELSQALGYPGTEPPVGMAGLISSTAEEIHSLCDFRAGYLILPLAFDASQPDGVKLGTRFFRTEKIIRNQLKGVDKAALLLCTIGSKPEQRARQLLENGDPALGFIADTAASVLAEKVAEVVHRHLEMKFESEGLGVTNRFSPGYCGWNVHEQHELFSLLPDGFCGVHLEDSAFMQPRKSVSAIVGIGKAMQRSEYPCVKCNDNQCLYRESNTLKKKTRKV